MTLWAFTVLTYLVAQSGQPQHTLAFPTREACEAARQAVLEIGQEERPNPVVGLCRRIERTSVDDRTAVR